MKETKISQLIQEYGKQYILDTLHDIIVAYSCAVTEETHKGNLKEHIAFLDSLYSSIQD